MFITGAFRPFLFRVFINTIYLHGINFVKHLKEICVNELELCWVLLGIGAN